MTCATTFRRACLADADAVIGLVQRRIEWMDACGLHQWNETDYFGRYPRTYWEENIGSFLVGLREGRVVVAMALYTSDIRWGKMSDEAYYLHHLVSDIEAKGAGAELMLFAERYAVKHGVAVLRLDSAVGNGRLEEFYTRLGYVACGLCHDRLYHGVLREKMLAAPEV